MYLTRQDHDTLRHCPNQIQVILGHLLSTRDFVLVIYITSHGSHIRACCKIVQRISPSV
ncbi:hypothetical protein PAXRUDRAFT_822373 [Paxillus rubicundulus Ve08.2h10]|uniref:Uncharacterized protein n=1 Tax=Paxillus rubicundulus Ve08.2h10 TaxID=930991 RepID=A0A0D0ECQ1_9AGAM|nr:hypothetical protein PAXRUDRAFT_822373 [Paxillus rubicundulus Ve08.2h10]